jgi:hypothetical protein
LEWATASFNPAAIFLNASLAIVVLLPACYRHPGGSRDPFGRIALLGPKGRRALTWMTD